MPPPANENIAPFQQSGSANVPMGESTGSQYQAADSTVSDNIGPQYSGYTSVYNLLGGAVLGVANSGGQGILQLQGIVAASGYGGSGYFQSPSSGGPLASILIASGLVNPTVWATQNTLGMTSGANAAPLQSGITGYVGGSGAAWNAPAGVFLVQVPAISGSPFVRIPFYLPGAVGY